MAVTSRPYREEGDLRRMQRLVQDAWRAVGPKNERHVGDGDVGAKHAVVLCRGDAGYPIPKRLYESVGFRQHSRILRFAKGR